MRTALAVLALGVMAAAGPLHAQQAGWQTERGTARSWSAVVRSGGDARLTVNCTDSGRWMAETSVEVVVSRGTPLAGEQRAILTAGRARQGPEVVRVGADTSGATVLRWSAVGHEGYAVLRKASDAVGEGGDIAVAAPDGKAQSFPSERADAVIGPTVLRCAPSVIGIRSRIASQRDPAALVALSNDANERCRGGSGDDPATDLACAERTEIGERLNALGQCYGRRGEAGYQMTWHPCGKDSLR